MSIEDALSSTGRKAARSLNHGGMEGNHYGGAGKTVQVLRLPCVLHDPLEESFTLVKLGFLICEVRLIQLHLPHVSQNILCVNSRQGRSINQLGKGIIILT